MEQSPSKTDVFLSLFKDFDLTVTYRDGHAKPYFEKEALEIEKNNLKIKKELERALKKVQEDYSLARKMFKFGKVSKDELIDYEWRIFELNEQINQLNEGEY
jgi:hypothetical protein